MYYYAVSAYDNSGRESNLSTIVSYLDEDMFVSDEWELVSNPVSTTQKPSDVDIFQFDGTYKKDSALVSGKGYWVKNNNDTQQTIDLRDQGVDSIMVNLNQGWNMIGGLADTLQKANIVDPNNSISDAPMYLYEPQSSSYKESSKLVPKQGYWLHAENSGKIYLKLDFEAARNNSKKETVKEILFDEIIFSSQGASKKFLYAANLLSESEQQRQLLPPIPPNTTLDIRSGEGQKATGKDIVSLKLEAQSYPVQVRLNKKQDNDFAYRLIAQKGEDELMLTLTSGNSQQIKKGYEDIRLKRIAQSETPIKNKLLPNYPNPFNPTTTIKYRVGSTSDVSINVYNVLGKRIRTLVDKQQQPGVYTEQFNGSNLASGLYFIRIKAGQYNQVQKMMLIK